MLAVPGTGRGARPARGIQRERRPADERDVARSEVEGVANCSQTVACPGRRGPGLNSRKLAGRCEGHPAPLLSGRGMPWQTRPNAHGVSIWPESVKAAWLRRSTPAHPSMVAARRRRSTAARPSVEGIPARRRSTAARPSVEGIPARRRSTPTRPSLDRGHQPFEGPPDRRGPSAHGARGSAAPWVNADPTDANGIGRGARSAP